MNASQNLRQTRNNFTAIFTYFLEKKSYRVLVAEADPENLEILQELLELYDIEVVTADSGEAVIDGAVMFRPDLIIIDNQISGMNGFESIRLLRAISSLSDVPVIFLSDYPERTERIQAFAAGCNDYLVKPLDLDRLDQMLEKFLFAPAELSFK